MEKEQKIEAQNIVEISINAKEQFSGKLKVYAEKFEDWLNR